MEKSGLSVCVDACMSVHVCVCVGTRTCMYVRVTEGSVAAVCNTGWQGGCQNGPVSCVSSKIGPNTAEMHDTLWLFTALTQCVCAGCCQVYGTRRIPCCTISAHRLQKRCIHLQYDSQRRTVRHRRLIFFCAMFYVSQ